MAKTTFTDTVTIVTAAFLNKVFRHNHLNLDEDGSCNQITIEELEDTLQALLGDLSGIRSLLPQLFYEDKIRTNIFGGLGSDGAYNGTFPLDREQYEFTSFNIPVGTNVQVTNGVCRIKVKGAVTIAGSLTAQPKNPAGIGQAWFTTGGQAYNMGASLMGSAGAPTVDHTNQSGLQVIRDRGGFGGSHIGIEALDTITVTGTIACNGAPGQPAQILSGNPILGGSGGGSGGSLRLQSFSGIQINGTLDLLGGAGANAYGNNAMGGGGGSGGWGHLIAPLINIAANAVRLNGGVPGSRTGSAINLGGGGGGYPTRGGNTGEAGATGRLLTQILNNWSTY